MANFFHYHSCQHTLVLCQTSCPDGAGPADPGLVWPAVAAAVVVVVRMILCFRYLELRPHHQDLLPCPAQYCHLHRHYQLHKIIQQLSDHVITFTVLSILGDPGAVSREGKIDATKGCMKVDKQMWKFHTCLYISLAFIIKVWTSY